MLAADLLRTSKETPVPKGQERAVPLGANRFSRAENANLQVGQDLEAVIIAGKELFGVVKAEAKVVVDGIEQPVSRRLLTRFATSAGETRASLVGFITEEPMQVGRTKLINLGITDGDGRLSREHFTVAVVDGELKVRANATTSNETQIVTWQAPKAPEHEEVAVKGLKKIFGRSKKQENEDVVPEASSWNPSDVYMWSIDSATAKTYLQLGSMGNKASWDYTMMAAVHSPELQYGGRDILRRDSKIDGGVMVHFDELGRPIDEAAEIDFDGDEIYAEWLDEVKARAIDSDMQRITGKSLVDAVFAVVHEKMRYSLVDTTQVIADRTGGSTDRAQYAGKTMPLSAFLHAGVGVCRHQGATAALIMERILKDLANANEGMLTGEVSFDANINWNAMGDERVGGHAWARFKSGDDGEVYIIDVAQGFHGRLVDAKGDHLWKYARPEDEALLRASREGASALLVSV